MESNGAELRDDEFRRMMEEELFLYGRNSLAGSQLVAQLQPPTMALQNRKTWTRKVGETIQGDKALR
jgi:hypothetical protein